MLGNVNFFSNLTPAQIKKYDLDGDGKLSESEKETAKKTIEQESAAKQASTKEIPVDYTFGVMISQYSNNVEEKQIYENEAEVRKAFNTIKESFNENYIKQLQENKTLSDEEKKSIITFLNTKATAFIDQYFNKNPQGPYDIEQITAEYMTNIQQLLAQKEENETAVKEQLSEYKDNTDSNYDKLAEMIEVADADYITDSEYEEIKKQASKYILGELLNGNDITAFMSAINPSFKNNQNYSIVKSCITALQKETDPEKVAYYIERAEKYIGNLLGTKANDGTSKLTDAIKAQNLAEVKQEASVQIDKINDELNEAYFENKTAAGEEFTTDDVNAHVKKYANIKDAFLAQYTGDGSDIETAYNEFLAKIEQETQDILALIESQKGTENSYENLRNTVKETGSYVTKEEQDEIKSAAIEYITSVLISDEEDLTLLAQLYPNYKTDGKYLQAKQLLNGIASSATPKEDYEKALQLLNEMEANLSYTQVTKAMANEETRIKKAEQEKYGEQLDKVIDEILENYSNETIRKTLFSPKETYAHSEEEIEQYKQKLDNVKAEFLGQYTGDGSDLEAKFQEFLNNVNTAYETVNNELTGKKDTDKAYSEIKESIDNAGRYTTQEEEATIKEKTTDYILSVIINGTEDKSLLSSILPNYITDGKYLQAKQLIDGLATSATPKEDWELAQQLIEELIKNTTLTSIENAVEAEELKNVNIKANQISQGIWGYNNNATHGGDDLVRPQYTIENGQIRYTHKDDANDVTKSMSTMLENIKEQLKEQLGDLYNEEEINNCFNQAQINALLNVNPDNLMTVATLVNNVLKEFNTLMTEALHDEKDSSFVKSNYGDTSLTDGLSNFYGSDDRFYYKHTGIDSDGTVYLKHGDNTDFQNTMKELSNRIVEKYKAELGSQLSDADIEKLEKYIQQAISNALDVMKGNHRLAWGGSCKGDKHANSFTVLVNQTLFELDKILYANNIG